MHNNKFNTHKEQVEVHNDFLSSSLELDVLREIFTSALPFKHIVIDNFFKPDVLYKIRSCFPQASDSIWYEYNNPLEKKLACNEKNKLPNYIANVLDILNSKGFLQLITGITGVNNLIADEELHGGGIHCIKPGGKLDMHIDYSIHPKLKLERRLNLIIYLNEGWQKSWGGELQFWNDDMSKCVKSVEPIFNRAVIFATDDASYHGHPEPLNFPEGRSRDSLALYYLTEPQKDATERYRARFVARPTDDKSKEMEEFRMLRSGLTTGEELRNVRK